MPNFEKDIRGVMEDADLNKNKKIDENEKGLVESNIKVAEALYTFSTGDKKQVLALELALNTVAPKYGLEPGEIMQWINEVKPLNQGLEGMGSRRLGKPPKPSEAWERLDTKKRKDILTMILREKMEKAPKLSPSQKRHLKQLDAMITFLQAEKKMLFKGKNYIEKAVIGMSGDVKISAGYARIINDFIREKSPKIAGLIISNPTLSFSQLIQQTSSRVIYSILTDKGFRLDETRNSSELVLQQVALVKQLRKKGDYENAHFTCEKVLRRDLEQVFKDNRSNKNLGRIKVPGSAKREKVYKDLYINARAKIHKKMVEKGMDVNGIAKKLQKDNPKLTWQKAKAKALKYIQSLIYQEYSYKKHRKLLSIVNDKDIHKKWSPAKQKLWAQYKDSMGIGNWIFNPSDKSWDAIVDELIINAPLIIISGGVASGVRAIGGKVLSAAGKQIAQRSISLARLGGAISKNAGVVGRWAARSAITMPIEGAVFEFTNARLRGEWLHQSPEWAQRIIWSSISLGAFKSAGKLSNTLVGKKGLLKAVNKIKNPHMQKGVRELLLKGHIEVVTMLLIGAAQNAYYEGNLDDFIDNIGEEIFHSYVSAGSLKISGAGVEFGKKMFGFKKANTTVIEGVRKIGSGGTLIESPGVVRKANTTVIEGVRKIGSGGTLIESPGVVRKANTTVIESPVVQVRRPAPQVTMEGALPMAKDYKKSLDVPLASIQAAIVKGPGIFEGLPGTTKPTNVYFLPTKGAGGFGQVREVFYKNTNGIVVKKVVKSPIGSQGELINAFVHEVKILRVVNRLGVHPNLMKVAKKLTIKDANGKTHIILENAGNVDGFGWLSRNGVTTKDASKLIFQNIAAIEFLHSKGIAHGDIKLVNTMVNGKTGNAKVIDFGSLTALEGSNTPHSQSMRNAQLKDNVVICSGYVLAEIPIAKKYIDHFKEKGAYGREYDIASVFAMVKNVEMLFDRKGVSIKGTRFEKMIELANEAGKIPKETNMAEASIQLHQLYNALKALK